MAWGKRTILATGAALAAIFATASDAHAPTSVAEAAKPVAAPLVGRTLQDAEIAELSGLAASRLHPDVLFGVNDSGGLPVVYAIDATGATVARLALAGLAARDWEALAPSRDAEGNPVLWIGDIGDNRGNQERVRLIRIREPAELSDRKVRWEAFWVAYPDGPRDAEALLADPRDGTLSVVSKGNGVPGGLYRVPAPLRDDSTNVMTRVMDVPPGITDGGWELTPAGEPRLVLTDYLQLHRMVEGGWISAWAPLQLQREALAWPHLPGTAGGGGSNQVYLGSEGVRTSIVVAPVP